MRLIHFILLTLFIPPVYADIYRWTDENGSTVLSDVPPPEPKKAKNFKTVLKGTAPAAPVAAPASGPTLAEQELRLRLERLERELQARQYVMVPAPPPPPVDIYYRSAYPNYYYPVRGPSYFVYPPASHATAAAFAHSWNRTARAGNAHGGRR
jgi:hypothetical protein